MPTSYNHVIPLICDQLEKRQPKKVLDIGIGYGKYGLLAREYGHATVVDGVEAEPRYITEQQLAIYDKLYLLDIGKAFTACPQDYDLILFIDCIEHLPKEKAHQVLRYFKGSTILVATPEEDLPQHSEEYPFENHISKWDEPDFAAYPYERIFDPKNKALIVVVNP